MISNVPNNETPIVHLVLTVLTMDKLKQFNYHSRYVSSLSVFYLSILMTSCSHPPPVLIMVSVVILCLP